MIALSRGTHPSSNHNGNNSSSAKHTAAVNWVGTQRNSTQGGGLVGTGSIPGSQLHHQAGASRLPPGCHRPASQARPGVRTATMPSGLKIRIPRDLPNLPEAFRKRGAIRSQPSAQGSAAVGAPASIKRSYSAMMIEDHPRPVNYVAYAVQSEGPRIKLVRRHPPAPALGSIPPHLVGAKNLAIRTIKAPVSASNSPSINNSAHPSLSSAPTSTPSTADGQTTAALLASVQKHRNQSKSKSSSPISTPSRVPSPVGTFAETAVVVPTSSSSPALDSLRITSTTTSTGTNASGPRSGEGVVQVTTAGSGAVPSSTASNAAVSTEEQTTATSDPRQDDLKPVELVRVCMGILSTLICNTFCKSFINKVPLSVANYHLVIKRPMDLTTIEHKLYRTLELASVNAGAGSSGASELSAVDGSDRYTTLDEFERDLRRIYQNATYFNLPTHVIYKDAQAFQTSYKNLFESYRKGELVFNTRLPQETFQPELISLSEPGPLYLFRAHTLREMERKMTDISQDLFASFHQPIFDISTEQIGKLSPEKPRFVRMYINKNRSILAKSRDEHFARVVIVSDYQVGKPYTVTNSGAGSPVTSKPSPGARGRPAGGASGGSISMVRIMAKVLIGKPIGERHDMVTVGDLDCPNAWITVACVRALDIDMEVPAKFDKILAKMRHEVVAYSSDPKIGTEHQRAFAEALGLLLPSSGRTGYGYGGIGLRSAIPAPPSTAPESKDTVPAKGLGLGITTPSTLPTTTALAAEAISADHQKSSTSDSKSPREPSKGALVDLHDHGPSGRYMVKMRIPSLLKTIHRPAPESETASVTTAAPSHPLAASTPSTPLLPARVNILSSQIPATPSSSTSDMESLSAPDRIMLSEQITKRGHKMLLDLKVAAEQKGVPYTRWSDIEPTLTVDSAHGLFKRIYHVRDQEDLVVQNFKEMDAESFEMRVREVACLLMLKDLDGVGQIQSIIDNQEDHLVGLSMTKYPYTLKQYATNARRHPTPAQKLCLVRDMVSAMCEIHKAGLAHRDLSEVNIMVDEHPNDLLDDKSPRPHIKVIDFGKSVFVKPDEVQRWSMQEQVSESELALLPMVILPPDHGYKLYRSILTLPRTKQDHIPLDPVDPRSEDVYSLGVLIWRTFSGKSPWNGAIEDDLKTIRYLVSTDLQIRFQLEKEVAGPVSRELLLHCLTARAETRWSTERLKEWLEQPEVAADLLREFEDLGGGRKKVRKNLD